MIKAPDAYALTSSLIPKHLTDVAEAQLLSSLYADRLAFSTATEWLVYDGTRWVMNNEVARSAVHELTFRQEQVAAEMELDALRAEQEAQRSRDDAAVKEAEKKQGQAKRLRKAFLGFQQSGRVSAILREATPYLQVRIEELDSDPFLLNTPKGTVDLRTGKMQQHNPADRITHITSVSPSDSGTEEWRSFLDAVTCGDTDLLRYLQTVAGAIAVGAVFSEKFFIAIGGGGNGKSTFHNTLFNVLGDYASIVPADILTIESRTNKSFILAELRGKRFVLAKELKEGQHLDTSALKILASTDPIRGEFKHRDGFTFLPSHCTVLYTNHLPKVGATDNGTWDRLVCIPFNAKFRGQRGEIENYAAHLHRHCGGAVLQWIIDGAKMYIDDGYKFTAPPCVVQMIADYRATNDVLARFISECCLISPENSQPGQALYDAYRQFCLQSGEYIRPQGAFKQALSERGYASRKTKVGSVYTGLTLRFQGNVS